MSSSRTRTTQIFFASTLYGAATLAAALDAGVFADADRRILLVSNNAAIPETTPAVDAMPGFDALRGRFDDIVSWNATIAPTIRAAGPRAPTTYRCGNGICASLGDSATTTSSSPSSRSRSTRRWRSPRSSPAYRSMCTRTG